MDYTTAQSLLSNLEALRVECGLTQKDFAEQACLSYDYDQAWEVARKMNPRLSTLERLAEGHGTKHWQFILPGETRPTRKTY